MKSIRPRFIFWALGWLVLFVLANLQLRPFPHIFIIFWTLLPILSIIFSKLSDRKLKAKLTIRPQVLQRGQEGHWICRLTNESPFMAFFLLFPDLKIVQGKKEKPMEVMLQPKETRTVDLAFMLPFTGTYTLETKEPIYEDFLGFIRMSFSQDRLSHMVHCYALPSLSRGEAGSGLTSLADDLGDPIQKKNLTTVTDDLFSIEPLTQGESMAHVHWKLTARLQEFMVKRYSDTDQEPLRIIVHTADVEGPSPHFMTAKKTDLHGDRLRLLMDRNFFLDQIYTFSKAMLDRRQVVRISDVQGQYKTFPSIAEEGKLRLWLARLPFRTQGLNWKIEPMGDKAQVIFIQRFDQESFGALIQAYELGIYFICLSYLSMNDPDMVEKVKKADFSCLWLDEEKGGGHEN